MTDSKPTTAFPEVLVTLMSGKTAEVRPWSLKKGRLMRQRITKVFDTLQAAGKSASSLTDIFDVCETQVYEIVRDTIGVDDEWMETNVAYEDLFTLAQSVIEVCLMRGGTEGVMGKFLGAMGLRPGAAIASDLQARLEEARSLGLPENPTPTQTTEL